MIKRTIVLIFTCAFFNVANAEIFKCISKSGAVEYKSTPCQKNTTGNQSVLKTKPANELENNSDDNAKMTINDFDMSLSDVLQVIADFSGNQLKVAPAIKDVPVKLSIKNTGWRDVLKKVAADNHVSIYVENKTIKAIP